MQGINGEGMSMPDLYLIIQSKDWLINVFQFMADGRKQNGGRREGAGRKPKTEEQELIARLSPLDDEALKQLTQGLKSGDVQYLKMFMEYRYGKPKQSIDAKVDGSMELVWNEVKSYGTNA